MANRTALFVRQQPGGVFTVTDATEHPGDIWFVNSATGTDGAGYGQNPDAPVASKDYAVGLATANNGDVVYLMPGHAETINTAGGITLDKAGLSVVGLGNGEDRPVITVGSSLDTATVLVSAVDVKLKNIVFQPGNDGVDVLLDIDADGCVVEDCEFRSDETNAYQADSYIDVNGGANAADRCAIRRCRITSPTAGAAQGIEIGAVEDQIVIEDCWIDGDFTAAGIHSASAFTNSLIARNYVANRNAGEHAIELSAAATGMLVDNRLYGDTLGTILDPGSMMCLGNLETDAIDQAGVDSPRTSAGGFADNSITAAVIATGAIDSDAIADNAIDAGAIAAGAIAADAFAAGAIDAAAIANGAIDAATFAAGAIDAAAIADGAIDAATFAAGAIDAASIAANAIDAATFAADALQAFQDECQDAIQGEQLDHLTTVAVANSADMTTEVADGTILSNLLTIAGDTSDYVPATDSLEALADSLAPRVATGEADIDVSAADYTAYVLLLTIEPAAGAPLWGAEVVFDLAKAATGFAAGHAAQTIQFAVARKVDGTNYRIEAGDPRAESTAISGTNSAGRAIRLDLGSIGVTEDCQVFVKLSAENGVDVELPYALSYHASAAPTVTPVAAA